MNQQITNDCVHQLVRNHTHRLFAVIIIIVVCHESVIRSSYYQSDPKSRDRAEIINQVVTGTIYSNRCSNKTYSHPFLKIPPNHIFERGWLPRIEQIVRWWGEWGTYDLVDSLFCILDGNNNDNDDEMTKLLYIIHNGASIVGI